jgi:hypothetical protein
VSLMHTIYRAAEIVITWLDVSINQDDPLFSRMVNAPPEWADRKTWIKPEDYEMSAWQHMLAIVTNDYWNRLWIQGEVVNASRWCLAHRTGSLCAHYMPAILAHLETFLLHLLRTDSRSDVSPRRLFHNLYDGISLGFLRKHGSMEGQDLSLIRLMARHLRHQAADPRDLIYALMSFASDCDEGDVPIDYDATLAATFLVAIRHHIKKHRNLKFIQHVHYIPICVVDWAKHVFPVGTWACSWTQDAFPHDDYGVHEFNRASGRLACLSNAVSLPNLTIVAQGFCIDHVLKLPGGPYCSSYSSLSQTWANLLDTFPDLSCLDHAQGDEINDAILWMLMAREIQPLSACTPQERADLLSALRILHSMARSPKDNSRTMNSIIAFWRDFWPEPVDAPTAKVFDSLARNIAQLCFYTLRSGLPGSSPWNAHQAGDQIWIIFGCDCPMILRPAGIGFTLIQSAFVLGFMQGEAVGGADVCTPFRTGDLCNGHVVEEIQIL